jgi:hypothetical protein
LTLSRHSEAHKSLFIKNAAQRQSSHIPDPFCDKFNGDGKPFSAADQAVAWPQVAPIAERRRNCCGAV